MQREKNVVYVAERQYLVSKELDPRYQRTHKSIKEAFASLICEKPYSKITINEITNRALVNRNTFYLHYPDILALLNDFLIDGVTLRETPLTKNDLTLLNGNFLTRTMKCLKFCFDHPDLMYTALKEFQTTPYLRDYYYANLQSHYNMQKVLFPGDLTRFTPDDHNARFILAGETRLIGDWINKGQSEQLEDNALHLNSLVIKTNCVFLGVDVPKWVKDFS